MSIPAITAALTALEKLKRICPRCHREQMVTPEQQTETVPCQFCQARIPPREPTPGKGDDL